MKFKCNNCDKSCFICKDEQGRWQKTCPICGATEEVTFPTGKIVLLFAWDELLDNFTDELREDTKVASVYSFESVSEFKKTWLEKVEGPDSMWYWVYQYKDDGTPLLVCSGAWGPGDDEILAEYFGKEWKENADDDPVHVILRDGNADDAIEALEAAEIDAEYLDDTRILVPADSAYEEVLDRANIKWDIA